MQRICTALAKAGFKVTIYGFHTVNQPTLENKPYRQVRLKRIFKKGKLFYLEYNLRLVIELLKHKYDVYTAIDLDTALPHYIASKWHKQPMCIDAHEYFLGLPEIQHRPVTKWFWKSLERFIYPTIKKAYTVNESIAKLYETEYDIEMTVVRNCPELTETEGEKENYILYQGALNEGRGLEELITAMQWVGMPLKIAGSGTIDEELKQLVQNLNLHHKITFLGYVLPKDLKNITVKAAIGINLLKGNCLNYYYSLANKFFDYMHAKIPQISMNFPEYRLINKKYEVAVLVENLNPKHIAKQLNKLIENKKLYAKLTSNCKVAKQIFNWEIEKEQLIKFYHNLEQ